MAIANQLVDIANKVHAVEQQNEQLKAAYQNVVNAYQGVFLQSTKFFKKFEIIPNKIVFISYDGKGYGCNPKYIAEEILRRNLPVDMVWLVDNPNYPMPEKIRKVPYNTLDSIYELSTAQVIITNEMTRMLFEKKKDQYVIMTWHGAWGLKYINLDMGERVTPALVEAINASNAVTDLMIADSDENFAEIRRSFDWKGEVIKCGMPRQDLFFKNNRDIKDRVKKSLGIPTDRNDIKILLYVPTFRDVKPQPVQAYQMDFQKLLRVLAEKFGGQWGALMRLHPILSTSGLSNQIFKPAPNILDVTAYPDVQELLLIADIVLTDYSSAIYDVMLQSKPALIWAKDVEWYEKARGLKPHFYELPYKVNRTEDELFDYIKNLDINKLKKDVKKYCAKIAPYDKGDAAKKVVNKICSVMKIK